MMKKRKLETEIKKLEQNINALEEELSALQEQLQTEEVVNDYVKYNEITETISNKETQLETIMEQWEELSDILNNRVVDGR